MPSNPQDEATMRMNIEVDLDAYLDQIAQLRSYTEEKLRNIHADLNFGGLDRIKVDKSANPLRADFIQLDRYAASIKSGRLSTPKEYEDVNTRLESVMAKMQSDALNIERQLKAPLVKEYSDRFMRQGLMQTYYNNYISQGMSDKEAQKKAKTRFDEQMSRYADNVVNSYKLSEEVIRNTRTDTNSDPNTLYGKNRALRKDITDFGEQHGYENISQPQDEATMRMKSSRNVAAIIVQVVTAIGRALSTLLNVLGDTLSGIGGLVSNAVGVVNNAVGGATSLVTSTLGGASSIVSSVPIVGNLLSLPLDVGRSGVSALGSVTQGLLGGVGSATQSVFNAAGNAVNGIGNAGNSLFGGMSKGAAAGAGIGAAAGSVIPGVGTAVGGAAGAGIGAVVGGIGGAISGAGDVLKGGLSAAMSIAGGVVTSAGSLIDGGVKALLQIPSLIEETARKLIRSITTLTATIAGITKLVTKDVSTRFSQSREVNGYFTADKYMANSENYHRTVERLRNFERIRGDASFYKTDTILAQAAQFQNTIAEIMTGDGVNDKRVIDYSFILRSSPELARKYSIQQMVSGKDFSPLQFMMDAMASAETNWNRLFLSSDNNQNQINYDAYTKLLGNDVMNMIQAHRNYNATSLNTTTLLGDALRGGGTTLGRGLGSTAVTERMRKFQVAVDGLKVAFDDMKRNISTGLVPLLEPLIKALTDAANLVGTRFNSFYDQLNDRTIVDSVKDIFADIDWGEFRENLSSSLSLIWDFFKQLAEGLGQTFFEIIEGVKEAFSGDVRTWDEFKNMNWWEKTLLYVNPFKQAGFRVAHGMNAVSSATSNESQRNKELVEEYKKNSGEYAEYFKEILKDSWSGLTNLVMYGAAEIDENDKADVTAARKKMMNEQQAEDMSESLMFDRKKGNPLWFNFLGGMKLNNYDDYKYGTPYSYEKLVYDGLTKSLNRQLTEEEQKEFEEGGRLDITERGFTNPQEYYKQVNDAILEMYDSRVLESFVNDVFSRMSPSFIVDHTSGKATGVRVMPVEKTYSGEYNIRIKIDSANEIRTSGSTRTEVNAAVNQGGS